MIPKELPGRKLCDAARILKGLEISIKLTKAPWTESEINDDSRILKVTEKDDGVIELVVCNPSAKKVF